MRWARAIALFFVIEGEFTVKTTHQKRHGWTSEFCNDHRRGTRISHSVASAGNEWRRINSTSYPFCLDWTARTCHPFINSISFVGLARLAKGTTGYQAPKNDSEAQDEFLKTLGNNGCRLSKKRGSATCAAYVSRWGQVWRDGTTGWLPWLYDDWEHEYRQYARFLAQVSKAHNGEFIV